MTVPLTLAIGEYDHVRDLVEGRVRPQGIDLTWLNLPVEEIFLFRLSAIYVRTGAGIETLGDLAGRRVGVPEWPAEWSRIRA